MDAEVIVVDNNSKDGSCAMVRERFPNILLIENSENVGFAVANNQGVDKAKGEYVCILNPDTVIAADTFIKMIEVAEELPNKGLIGPRLIDGRGNFLPESKRNIPSPLASLQKIFGFNFKKIRNYYATHVPDDQIGAIDVLVGAFILVKKKDYQDVGGFDEDYFMYGEDIDLSYKIKKNGLQNYYIGGIVAIHYKGESTDRNIVYVRRFYGAMRLFYEKHFRTNWFLDFLVSVGIRIVSLKHFIKRSDFITNKNIDCSYLISEDMILCKKLSDVLGRDIQLVSIESIEDLGVRNMEVIFDNNFIAFQQIITEMVRLKRKNMIFKIRPKNCNYIIGSDSSDGRGEVVIF